MTVNVRNTLDHEIGLNDSMESNPLFQNTQAIRVISLHAK